MMAMTLYESLLLSIHLSNVLTDHFSNSLPEETYKDVPMKFSQCPFKTLFIDRGIHFKINQVKRKASLTFNGISNWIFYMTANLLIRKTEKIARIITSLCSTLF